MAQTGQSLTVFDPDPAKLAPLTKLGASAASSAAEAAAAAAAAADTVITSLNAPQIVEAAVFGAAGVAEGARPGTLIVDMSSIDPGATRDLAARAQDAGLRWIDSPLSGGPPKALTGELTLMAGGSAEDVKDVRDIPAPHYGAVARIAGADRTFHGHSWPAGNDRADCRFHGRGRTDAVFPPVEHEPDPSGRGTVHADGDGDDLRHHATGHSGHHRQPASGEWAACVEERGNWTRAYEHYGEYTTEGGFQGTSLILQAYPEASVIHNANTAMAMGSVQAQIAVDATDDVFSTGWGGTGLELDAIRRGELDATPMRMGDDVGTATAEAIKYHLEGRADELPFVFLGRITVAHDQMSAEELAALEMEAFRFSGVEPLER